MSDQEKLRARPGIRKILKEASNWGELRKTPYGLTPVLTLVFVGFFQAFDNATFGLAQPEIARELKISIPAMVTISAIVGSLTIFAAIGVGWFADRHNRVPFVTIGTILSGVFSMLTGRATSLASLSVPRVVDDVSELASAIPRFSLLADYYPPDSRGKVFAMMGTLGRIPQFLAPAIAGFMVLRFGWRTTLVALGAPLVLTGIIAHLLLREPVRGYFERKEMGASEEVARSEDEPKSFGESWRSIWAIRTLRRLFIASIFSGAGGAVGFSYFGFFMAERYGLNPLQRGLISYPSSFAALAGGFIGGGLIDYFTRRNPGRVLTILGLFGAVSAVGLTGIAFGPPLAILIGFFSIMAFGSALVGPAAAVVFAQVIPPNVRTQGLQMMALAALPGNIIFVPIGASLFARYGYTTTFLSGVPLLILGAFITATSGGFFDLDRRNATKASMAKDDWIKSKAGGKGKLLVCRQVDVEYDGVQVLFGVDFDVDEGEIVALLGTNGAGKSTLLRAISGTQEASGGGIVFDGRDITHMPAHEIAQRKVIHMPGGRGVFPRLTVRENLLMGEWLSEDKSKINERLQEVFQIFPILRERINEQAATLSGGEQQMLSLALAFLTKPRLLMIDELSLGLSPAVVGQLIEIVLRIHAAGTTVIVVEQSVNVALTLARRAVFMEKGEVKFFGETSELLNRPDILRAVYVKGTGALTESSPTATLRSARDRKAIQLKDAAPALEVESLVRRFGGVLAVNGVSFTVREGEILGLIGPNGAGKTTIFDMISGFQIPDEGAVRFQGVDITSMGPEERARKGLVRRFQDARLFPALTVFETLLCALDQRLEVRNVVLNAMSAPGVRKAERRVRVQAERLIDLFELGSYRDKFVKELSTGLRRIVDLTCVMATNPKVLLLDEPSSGIAQAEAEGLAPLLRRVRYETGCALLIIEHDMPLISALSDELIALDQGAVVTRGQPEVVLNDERVIESYLGTSQEAIQRSGRLSR